MHDSTPIKSQIAEFFSIINDLDKIEVRIKHFFITVFFTFFVQEL